MTTRSGSRVSDEDRPWLERAWRWLTGAEERERKAYIDQQIERLNTCAEEYLVDASDGVAAAEIEALVTEIENIGKLGAKAMRMPSGASWRFDLEPQPANDQGGDDDADPTDA